MVLMNGIDTKTCLKGRVSGGGSITLSIILTVHCRQLVFTTKLQLKYHIYSMEE